MTRDCRYFSVFQSLFVTHSSLISSSVTQSSKIPHRTERDINDAIQVKNVELNYSLVILHIFSISGFGRNLLSPPSNSSIHKECPSNPVPMNNNIALITKSFTSKRGERMLEITGISWIASNLMHDNFNKRHEVSPYTLIQL